MRVLVGCETSGVVRRAFAARGHDAWSCDLLPAEDGSNRHFVGDVRDYLDPTEYRRLYEITMARGTSMSEALREIIREAGQ